MIVRLHNLSARSPAMTDAQAVSELLCQCEAADIGSGARADDDVGKRWQSPDFNLSSDAWVIATNKGVVAGYADVQRADAPSDTLAFRLTVCVHPDYRERGIETLLIWLAEERARQLSHAESAFRQVMITTMVSSLDVHAREIFLHEGYTCARHIWRVTIDMERMPASSFERGQLTVDLLLDVDDLPGTTFYSSHTTRQYEIYEKVLHTRTIHTVEPALDMQCAGA